LDDFHLDNAQIGTLDALKERIPDLKVTLFTIPSPPGRSFDEHVSWLRGVKVLRPWVEFAVHGWDHRYLECRDWGKLKTIDILNQAWESGVFIRGFKAPYWETSKGLYEGLIYRDWWIADHVKNKDKRPAGLRVYELDRPERVHGHIQNVCGNGLEEMFEYYASLKGPFQFVSEVVGA
jgi:hypothetical protein